MSAQRLPTVIQIITRLELGGAQQNTLDTCRGLDRSRFKVALFAGADGQLDSEAARIPGIDFRILPDLIRPVRPRRDLQAFRMLRDHIGQVVEQGAPVIVHTHSSKAGILGRMAARAAGVQHVVHTIHGFGHNAFNNPVGRQLALLAERHASRRTSRYVAVSFANLEQGRRLGLFRKVPVELIYSGFELEPFLRPGIDYQTARDRLGYAGDAPLIGTIACFKPQKDLSTLVRTARAVRSWVPDARFLREALEQQLSDNGLKSAVTLLGWRHDLPDILAALDLFLLTSRWEGLPRAIVQAMAAGVPVVATSVDGVLDIVKDGQTGRLAKPGDHMGLARCVAELLRDGERARGLAEKASAEVEPFDLGRMIKSLESLYEDLLRTGRASRTAAR